MLTAGPTPRVDSADRALTVDGMVAAPRTWTAAAFAALGGIRTERFGPSG